MPIIYCTFAILNNKIKNMEITELQANEWISSNEMPIIIDFFADWCSPCKAISPFIEKLTNKYKDKALIGKLNVDDCTEITSTFTIRNIPTLLFIKNGEVVDRHVGGINENELNKKFENFINT